MHLAQGFGAANAALRFTGEVGGPAAQVVTGSVEQAMAKLPVGWDRLGLWWFLTTLLVRCFF